MTRTKQPRARDRRVAERNRAYPVALLLNRRAALDANRTCDAAAQLQVVVRRVYDRVNLRFRQVTLPQTNLVAPIFAHRHVIIAPTVWTRKTTRRLLLLAQIGATLVALLTASLFVALRWQVILSAEVPSPGPGTLLKIVLVGLFFNQVLPTGVGGDAVRAWRCRKLGIGLGAAIRSILLDRACGYLVLVIIYAASLPSLLRVFADPGQRGVVVAVLGAALVGLIALLLLDYLPRPLLRLRLISSIAELSQETWRLFTHLARCGTVLGLSAVTIGLTILAFKLLKLWIRCPLSGGFQPKGRAPGPIRP